jgi:hypothetical protein
VASGYDLSATVDEKLEMSKGHLATFRRPLRIKLIFGACIFVLVLGAVVYFAPLSGFVGSYIDAFRFSDPHMFAIDVPKAYLSEQDALVFARKTLQAEGYDVDDWQPIPEGHSTMSPSGEKDWLFTRARDPRSGRIQFVNVDDNTQRRFVEIDLSEEGVKTYIWMPK